jgi:hypothetical protein
VCRPCPAFVRGARDRNGSGDGQGRPTDNPVTSITRTWVGALFGRPRELERSHFVAVAEDLNQVFELCQAIAVA